MQLLVESRHLTISILQTKLPSHIYIHDAYSTSPHPRNLPLHVRTTPPTPRKKNITSNSRYLDLPPLSPVRAATTTAQNILPSTTMRHRLVVPLHQSMVAGIKMIAIELG